MGLFAVLLAATVNGLALPFFVNRYEEATPETIETIRPILQYNQSLNHAFDYIFMWAACMSILLWSIAILQTGRLPKWISYLGFLLSSFAIIVGITGFTLVDLSGFRYFIFGIVSWILSVGVLLFRHKGVSEKLKDI